MPKRKQTNYEVTGDQEEQVRKRPHISTNHDVSDTTLPSHNPSSDYNAVNTTNVHIKSGGRIRNYAEYCLKWLKDSGDRAVTLHGQAACATKAVTVAELVKRLNRTESKQHSSTSDASTLPAVLAQRTEIGRVTSTAPTASVGHHIGRSSGTRSKPVIRITLTKLSSVMTASS
ncbi:hypothetical protein BDF22DRAFT_699384 [Syncephalis plumigaleata]|nr:hypothetical protein BDF22DRAFT_699384 [Syncephalis plumigaleata]